MIQITSTFFKQRKKNSALLTHQMAKVIAVALMLYEPFSGCILSLDHTLGSKPFWYYVPPIINACMNNKTQALYDVIPSYYLERAYSILACLDPKEVVEYHNLFISIAGQIPRSKNRTICL